MQYKNSFYGKTVAITGKLENYTRTGIQSRLLELGAYPASAVNRNTDYLLVGAKPGSKLGKAKALGIPILSEQEFEAMASKGEGVVAWQ